MKSDVIVIDNQGNGFRDAVEQTRKVAAFRGFNDKDSLHLQLFTEEMLSMIHSVTGEVKASFWLQCQEKRVELHLTANTVLDKEKRYQLISAASSRKNEAAKGFLGRLRDAFEQAMTSEPEHPDSQLSLEQLADLPIGAIEDPEWDGYERSVLKKLADDVKIGIRGGLVDMTVTKNFAE